MTRHIRRSSDRRCAFGSRHGWRAICASRREQSGRRDSARRAPAGRGRSGPAVRAAATLRSKPICDSRNIDAETKPAIVGGRLGAVSIRRAHACRRSCRRAAAVLAAETTPRRVFRIDQRLFDPTLMPARGSNARSWPSRKRACARRSSARGSRSTTRSSPPPLLQERRGALAATVADLEARLREINARVREGAALAGRRRGGRSHAPAAAAGRGRAPRQPRSRRWRGWRTSRDSDIGGTASWRLPDLVDAVAHARGVTARGRSPARVRRVRAHPRAAGSGAGRSRNRIGHAVGLRQGRRTAARG